MKRRHKSGIVDNETQYEDLKRRVNSKSGFWVGKLSVKKALPLALVLAMVFSIAGVVVSGEGLPVPIIKPTVHSHGVSPTEANDWDVPFTYHLDITAARNATLTLQIYQPANNTWENKSEWSYSPPHKRYNWSSGPIKPFIEQSWGGISSYRFLYDDCIINAILGPYSGPSIRKPEPAKLPSVNFSDPSEPNGTDEAYYNVDTGDTKAFDYSVTATSNDSICFDISLRVHDPFEDVWMLKGENKPTYFRAGETETLRWRDIRPFESLNKSSIDKYIGKHSKYTFVYPGGKSENFTGPKLVVAFKDPEINPEVVSWGDSFNYSINVSACRNLTITLQYKNYTGSEWVNASITDPTQHYTRDYPSPGWDVLTWTCTAREQWKDVRFKWWDG